MPTHTVMPHSLAKALMDSAMTHHDVGEIPKFGFGGMLGTIGGAIIGGPAGAAIGGALGSGLEGAIGGDGGMGQSSFRAKMPEIAKQDFLPHLTQQYQQQQDVYGQQQQLAQALLAQSQGQGPNPAQHQLAQATGQNVMNQGALMAGQRGAAANPALMARLAAQQGAQTQQQAAGQAATLQAQQQLSAQQALAQQQAQMAGQSIQTQGELYGAQANQNNSLVNAQLGSERINAGVAEGNQTSNNALMGSMFNAAGNAAAMLGGTGTPQAAQNTVAGGAKAGNTMFKAKGGMIPQPMVAGGPVPGQAKVAGDSETNDTQLAMLSPGEAVIPRSIMLSPDAPQKAAEFIQHLMDQKAQKKGYGGVISARNKVC